MKSSAKQTFINILRQFNLLQIAEKIRFVWKFAADWQANRQYIRDNPDFSVPPPYLAYDAYGHINWQSYFQTGKVHAEYICKFIREHTNKTSLTIGEWGCGPARVIRHFPTALGGHANKLFGFDYNSNSIEWCHQHIDGISFRVNTLAPPLPCESDSFDCMYCLSVFTHLSEELHYAWADELSRVVKPGGLILISTQGKSFRHLLLSEELLKYHRGQLVIRGKIKEGMRCFNAFHPNSFVRQKLFDSCNIIAHYPGPDSGPIIQDVWLISNR